jgi:hypothetical protein
MSFDSCLHPYMTSSKDMVAQLPSPFTASRQRGSKHKPGNAFPPCVPTLQNPQHSMPRDAWASISSSGEVFCASGGKPSGCTHLSVCFAWSSGIAPFYWIWQTHFQNVVRRSHISLWVCGIYSHAPSSIPDSDCRIPIIFFLISLLEHYQFYEVFF